MLHNAIYTLKSSGLLIAELAVSIKAACRIDLRNYPNDNQTCFIFLFTPTYSASSVTFSTFSAMLSKESLQGSIGFSEQSVEEDRSNILNTTIAGGFKLVGMNVQRFYAYGEFFTVNESVAALFSSIANTVLRYEICLQREVGGVYAATVSIPIFCITAMAFVAVTLPNVRISLLLLVFKIEFIFIYFFFHFSIISIILMLLQNDRMSKAIPADFDSEPFCVGLSRFLLFQLVIMLVFRVWFALETDRLSQLEQKKLGADGTSTGQSSAILPQFVLRFRPATLAALGHFQFFVRCLLAIEIVLVFWLLFF
ncbi:hypothetical protein niasHT_020454 [Heterodera trifolii]|uniref:Neurotransmitter-gated ion-channel ligand-binding domain-containing protein n=1 Tax=Heterodera trifolii TaxID=157864 RepID=A0ABD2JGB9_9BILA